MNRMCGQQTAEGVLRDFVDGALSAPTTSRDDVADIIATNGAHRIDLDGWKAIDAAERAAGKDAGRRRVKIVSIAECESTAGLEAVQ